MIPTGGGGRVGVKKKKSTEIAKSYREERLLKGETDHIAEGVKNNTFNYLSYFTAI